MQLRLAFAQWKHLTPNTLKSGQVLSAFVLLLLWSAPVDANTYRVYLRNKGISPFVKGSELYTQTQALLSDRCLARRAKVMKADSLFSLEDAPLYAPYLDNIRKTGAKILLELRWDNYVVVSCDTTVMKLLKTKSYVKDVSETGAFFKLLTQEEQPRSKRNGLKTFDTSCGVFRYGPSIRQNKLLNTDEFHAMGELGSRCLVGVLDNGFRYKQMQCFQHLRMLGEYDFVFQDSVTENESADVGSQDGHGTNTLSIIAAYQPDSLIGTAPDAQIMLAKTEDMRQEGRIEEDNYAAGIEWLEAAGVDVSSSSIGYFDFDSLQLSYNYSMLDGRSTICDRAVNRATARGMICCVAAGNEGGESRTLISPGDADSAITVGAVIDDLMNVPRWTSKGPNALGKLKPDVVALGVDVYVATVGTTANINKGNGTSFATPALAGAIALLVSQFPDLKPYEVRALLYAHANRNSSPDSIVGYGLPNMMEAATHHGIVVSPVLSYAAPTYQYFVYTIRSAFPIVSAVLSLSFDGREYRDYPLQTTGIANQYMVRIPKNTSPTMFFALSVQDAQRSRRVPELSYDRISFGESHIPCGMDPANFPSSVAELDEEYTIIPSAIPFGSARVEWIEKSVLTSWRIVNSIGQTVRLSSSNDSNVSISVADLPRGLYTIESSHSTQHRSHLLLIY